MSNTNGSGRNPIGPHGEGCDCPWPDEEQAAQEVDFAPPQMPKMIVSVQRPDLRDLDELIFTGVSDAFAAHFQGAIEQCAFDGEPLSAQQITHLMGGLMRGQALAHQTADRISANYSRLLMEISRAQEPDEPAEDGEEAHALRDIQRLFTHRPEDPPAPDG